MPPLCQASLFIASITRADFSSWHFSDIADLADDVRSRGQSTHRDKREPTSAIGSNRTFVSSGTDPAGFSGLARRYDPQAAHQKTVVLKQKSFLDFGRSTELS
jgi:hypothetical protein